MPGELRTIRAVNVALFVARKLSLYLLSRVGVLFFPRRKRRALRRHYNWLYGKITLSVAQAVCRQFMAFSAAKDSILEICFGSSHAFYGYLPRRESFNLSSGSQDLYTSYELYRRVSDAKSLKRVVLFVSVFSAGFQTERSAYCETCLFFHHYWGIAYRFHDKSYFQNRQRQLDEQEDLIKSVEIADYRGACDYGYFMNSENLGYRFQSHLKNNARQNGEIDYLEKFLAEADRCGHEAVIVIPPARSDYVAACPPNGELFAPVYDIMERHPRARLLDLFRSPQFSDDDFGDSDHVNQEGARKITAMIDDVIMV